MNKAMNKAELIAAISELSGETKRSVEATIDALAEVVKHEVSMGREVRLTGVFNLSIEAKEARTGRNPTTGEAIEIAAKNRVKLKPAKALTDAANGK